MPLTIPGIPAIPAIAPVQQRAGGVPDEAGLASAIGGRLSPAADPDVLMGREHELAVIGAAMARGRVWPAAHHRADRRSRDREDQPGSGGRGRPAGAGLDRVLGTLFGQWRSAGAWPWLQVLQGLAAVRRLPVSLRSLVDGESVTPADVQAARWRQQRDVAEYLQEVSRSAPLLVIVDDLQWADAASQQMLCGLAESVAGSRWR